MSSLEDQKKIISQLKEWIEKEREEEVNLVSERIAKCSSSSLQKIGLALNNLRIVETKIGLGGKTIIDFNNKNTGSALPPTLIKTGDVVEIKPQTASKTKSKDKGNKEQECSGVILKVTDSKVVVATEFELEIESGLWKITQLANEITYKRMIKVLDELNINLESTDKTHWMGNKKLIPLLLCNNKKVSSQPTFDDTIKMEQIEFNDDNLNTSQKEAILLSLKANHFALIHGPPGTGKTYTLIELIRQLVKKNKKILVCGPSNVSVDNLLERLVPHNVKCLRVGHPGRMQLPHLMAHVLDIKLKYSDEGLLVKDIRNEINQLLIDISKCKQRSERRKLYLDLKELRKEYKVREAKATQQLLSNAQVTLSTLNGVGSKLFWQQKYDILIIDEATQALEPECWIPIKFADKVIFAGDHHQLPPTIKTSNTGLENTLFQKLLKGYGNKVYKMLNIQYRMNDKIMNFSSKQLYKSELVGHSSVKHHLLKDLEHVNDTDLTECPLIFVDTSSSNLYESSEDSSNPLASSSKYNMGEIEIVKKHLSLLFLAKLKEEDIAIISPYNAQITQLKLEFKDTFPNLEIGTIDGFQGREKEAIIVTLVRSNDDSEIGFLNDYRRLNVAITRPKRHLCIIGDHETVMTSKKADGKGDKAPGFLVQLGKYLNEIAEVWVPEMYE